MIVYDARLDVNLDQRLQPRCVAASAARVGLVLRYVLRVAGSVQGVEVQLEAGRVIGWQICESVNFE